MSLRGLAAASFAALRVPTHLVSRLPAGVQAPTALQRAALARLMPRTPSEVALEPPPRSAVIRWPTGSGKTLAYALPLLSSIDPHRGGVQAVVVLPTRELVLQTLHVFQRLARHGRSNRKGNALKVMSLMGRVNTMMETELYHRPPAIAIGTPQPLSTLLRSGVLALTPDPRGRYLVCDEVDALVADHRWPHMASLLAATGPEDAPPARQKITRGGAPASLLPLTLNPSP